MNQSIQLSTSSILHIQLDKYEKDFLFIVNGQEFVTSTFIAELLSPKISSLRLFDSTLNSYRIKTNSNGNFQKFLDLHKFEPISFSSSESLFFTEIAMQLGLESIDFGEARSSLTIENAIGQLKQDLFFSTKEIQEDIDFISKHFHELLLSQKSKLCDLSIDTLEAILSNNNLVLLTEDELLQFVNELYSNSKEYSVLYSYVQFDHIEQMQLINNFIQVFDINDLNQSIWERISVRFKQETTVNSPNSNKTRYIPVENELKTEKITASLQTMPLNLSVLYSGNNWTGIFDYFRRESNIDEEVRITASSIGMGNLKHVIQPNNNTAIFSTTNEADSWICFEFLNHKINVQKYTIRSNPNRIGFNHLRNWQIEGSNNNAFWTVIDNVRYNKALNGPNFVNTFSVSNENNQTFKYIRILQPGSNWSNNHTLSLNCIEFYGLIE